MPRTWTFIGLRAQSHFRLQTSDLVISFISVIEIPRKFLMNNRKSRKNNAKLPDFIATSTQVGRYTPVHPAGSKLCASELTMITKRSSHMPMFTRIEMTNSARKFVRTCVQKSESGTRQLHPTMTQKNGAYEPVARSVNAPSSNTFPVYHAMKNSVA